MSWLYTSRFWKPHNHHSDAEINHVWKKCSELTGAEIVPVKVTEVDHAGQ